MRKGKDRRRQEEIVYPPEDFHTGTPDRRKLPDRRLDNLNAEQRQLLFSEMPGHPLGNSEDSD